MQRPRRRSRNALETNLSAARAGATGVDAEGRCGGDSGAAVGGVLDGTQARDAALRGHVEDDVAAERAIAEVDVRVVAQNPVDLGSGGVHAS